MTDRIIEIAETAAFLNYENHLLKIRLPNQEQTQIPVSEIQCLVLANPAVTVSGALLAALADAGCVVVVSGADRLPSGMLLPLRGNYIQTERFLAQIAAPKPLCKRLWQCVVQAKIRSQGALLTQAQGSDFGLLDLAAKVRSGDTDNLEARAAVIYWKSLFFAPFKRERAMPDNNLLLNYGYAILRAMTARACCAAGLHPTIGLQHHNRLDPYCLADDLMEPFRWIVDRQVLKMNPHNQPVENLSREMRAALLGALLEKISTKHGTWSVADLLRISAEQTARSIVTGELVLEYL